MEKIVKGALYVVATPLGHMGERSPRACFVVKNSDRIAAEDTRSAKKLFATELKGKKVESFFAPKEESKVNRLIAALKKGETVALLSEAGTPCICDPGYRLVARCREEGLPVFPVAGPAAVTAAMSVSGFPADRFLFLGFLPRKGKARKEALQSIDAFPDAVVIYEAPTRVQAASKALAGLAPERPLFVIRELSKKFEQTYCGSARQVADELAQKKPRGEYVFVLGPQPKPVATEEFSSDEKKQLLDFYRQSGSIRNAAEKFSQATNRPYRQAYKFLLASKKG